MALSKNGKGFTLELVVGIDDLFKQQAKEVEKEANQLEGQFKKLQTTLSRIDELKQLQGDLKKLENQTGATETQIKALTDKIDSTEMSLRSAGVSTSKLADEQKRLSANLAKTSQQMKAQEAHTHSMRKALERYEILSEGAQGLASAVGPGSLVANLGQAGVDRDKMLRMAAASTNASLEDLSSTDARRWRSMMVRQTGLTDEEVIAAQALSLKGTENEQDAQALAEQTLKLSKVQGMDVESVNSALMSMTRADPNLSYEGAAAILNGMKKNGDSVKMADIADVATEYSGFLTDFGLDSETAWAAALHATKGGAHNTDKVFDALKEGIAARLNDPSEMEKLMGKGQTLGAIDEYVTDESVRGELKGAIGEFRTAMANGESTGDALSRISSSLLSLYDTNPENAKVVAEGIFGTQGTEDLTKGGFMNFLEVLSGQVSAEEVLKTAQTLDESVELSQSAVDDLQTSGALLADSVVNVMATVSSSFKSVTNELKDLSLGVSDAGNEHQGLAGLALGALTIGGGLFAMKKADIVAKLAGHGKDFALRALGGGKAPKPADDLTGTTKETLKYGDVAGKTSPNKRPSHTGGTLLKNGMKSVGSTAGKALNKLPLIGAALSAGSLAMNTAEGDYESVFGDIGSILGGLGGGAVGTLMMPGIGTAAGSVGGAFAGDEAGRVLYRWLFGEEDTSPESVQAQIEKTEEAVHAIPSAPGTSASSAQDAKQVDVNIHNQFSFDLGLVNGEDDSAQAMLIQALRLATPEMQRQLKATLEELFYAHDNLALSAD